MFASKRATAKAYVAVFLILVLIVAVGAIYFAKNPSIITGPTSPAPSTQTPTTLNTPSLSPMLTPMASSTPSISPTQLPSNTPSVTPTLVPSSTPLITPTPVPSASPSPTSITPVQVTDLNWGGYLVASNLDNPQPIVTSVGGSWTVPAIIASESYSFSSVWVGIGGFFDNSLIQVGTEQDSAGGQVTYSAWYELLPASSITIDALAISPGDQMTASISLLQANSSQWIVSIADLTSGQQFQKTVDFSSAQLSAEWIVERPNVNNRISNLANFGSVSLSNCTAAVGSKTGVISSFPSAQIIMYQNAFNGREVAQLVTISDLVDNGSGFKVTNI